ncbi:hypothetical protein Pla108_01030 [Botrimarina colliarenosi]|uniref:Uncharacterized protein n=1 Tax=Botrimarina colliarenosi TaxID=2528001 RepID=A0A5C6AHR2_9BACT|nr:hypothetical protein [Botrimarina colliarenosi]TWT99169.1 hypothetical protein Pla108_01030 [Botrimarina colliarenosi]
MTPEDDPLELQQSLVESALPLVFEAYDEAVEAGVAHPMIVLLDCEDELGGEIARGWLGEDAIDDAIAAQAAGDDSPSESDPTTVLARAIGWDDAQSDLADAFPYLKPALDQGPPEDGVFVVGVTAGGASALTAPWDARS